MSESVPPPIPPLLPESAPFSPEQRAWLNGFFAGFLGLDGNGITALSPEHAEALLSGIAPLAQEASDDDVGEAPWHDPAMPLPDRMKLAEGRPLRARLMAAMGQQDCGQCGYNCQDYSGAIFLRKEERLNLCVPGGKETTRTLKALQQERGSAPATRVEIPSAADATAAPAVTPGYSRERPAQAIFQSRTRLNKPGSQKQTWHIEFDLSDCGIAYEVGDAFGIYPSNEPALADAVLAALKAPADLAIAGRTLRDVLLDGVSLGTAGDALFTLFSYLTGGERRQKARALAAGEDPDGDAESLDVLAAMEKFSGVRPDPEAFVEALDSLQPRLYSIASSPAVDAKRIALCVDAVRYRVNGRTRLGVASTFLGERIRPGERVKIYIQKAQHFRLPSDPSLPVIMIGPGTGIAPFRAFLLDRKATGAPGKNWLFFGHQRSDCDFFYSDELNAMKTSGLLTRLSLAWSRDGDKKFYVQDRMREVGRELWTWLAEGANVYICGDAKRMAKDVERALVDIVAQFGARTTDEAVSFVGELKKKGRLQQDVY